jgi:hypothetical protein
MQGLADAGHVAVAEDRPDAFDEALAILSCLNGAMSRERWRAGLRLDYDGK